MKDTLADSLGVQSNIAPPPEKTFEPEKLEEIVLEEDQFELIGHPDKPINPMTDEKEDYRHTRKTFKRILDIGSDAIEDLAELAKSTEQPRAYEVLGQIMKQMSETSKDLYAHQLRKKEIEFLEAGGRPGKSMPIHVDKAVFVGSATEMLDKLEREEPQGLLIDGNVSK